MDTGVYQKIFAALADPTRRQVLEGLKSGPLAVKALAENLPVSRPAVSQHLKVLEEAGLVTVEARGTARIYALDTHGVERLRGYVDSLFNEMMAAYAAGLFARK